MSLTASVGSSAAPCPIPVPLLASIRSKVCISWVMEGDRTWMYTRRLSLDFKTGLASFLGKAFAKVARGGQIPCPCKECKSHYWYRRDEVWNHVIAKGFVENYLKWNFHGEGPMFVGRTSIENENDTVMPGNINGLS
ncbi:unnamed protein product [Cuscuta epithymum]|uniref:Transposase-associated domain-containing protein n=1 Tax=Cuscuta epithymum TaxID=186058 RepID=A0AAV0EQ08_9ASTE|nr:unnamed protein product [Cuscuta epithymum]